MPTCRICQHTFKVLKFQTEHIDICTRCVNTLNESPEPAKNAETRFTEKLARGMLRNAERDLKSDEEWKRRKAQQTLENLDAAVAVKLHDWITQLLAKSSNSTRDFKIMRAHRRGLLRTEGFSDYADRNWKEVAQRIRRRDGFNCMACGATNTTLDVHHIIYLSHHGTNQQSNLITLCRKCHEAEHDRIFDFAESQDPESVLPIQPPPSAQTLSSVVLQPARTSTLAPASAPTPVQVLRHQVHDQQLDKLAVAAPPALGGQEQVAIAPSVRLGKASFWWQIFAAIVLVKLIGPFGTIVAILIFCWLNCRVQKWQVILGATTAGIAVTMLAANILQHYLYELNAAQSTENRITTKINTPVSLEKGVITAPEKQNMTNNSDLQPLNDELESQALQGERLAQQQKQQAVAAHYQKIYAAHPEADRLILEQDFERWSATPERQRVMKAGTADEVIKLFGDYKSQKIEIDIVKHSESAAVLSENGKTTCFFKPVMSDADYRACGISPPSM